MLLQEEKFSEMEVTFHNKHAELSQQLKDITEAQHLMATSEEKVKKF